MGIRHGRLKTNSQGMVDEWLAVLFCLSLLVPQIGYLGRGVRTTYAAFVVWGAFVVARPQFRQMVWRFRWQFILMLLFLPIVVATYLFRNGGSTDVQYIYGVIAVILAFHSRRILRALRP